MIVCEKDDKKINRREINKRNNKIKIKKSSSKSLKELLSFIHIYLTDISRGVFFTKLSVVIFIQKIKLI